MTDDELEQAVLLDQAAQMAMRAAAQDAGLELALERTSRTRRRVSTAERRAP